MERILTVDDLERLAIGAGILGTGGGGNPYNAKIRAQLYVKQGAQIRVVDINQVPDDALVTSVGGIGAPTVGVERLSRGDETLMALRALEAHIGKQFEYLVAAEIGGGNSIAPLIVAAQCGLPVIDGDGMGRAFPEMQMDTFSIGGVLPTPAAIANHSHHNVVFDNVADAEALERYARAVTIQMGGGAGAAGPVMSGAQVKSFAIPGTQSLAIAIGDAVLAARGGKGDPVRAALDVAGGERLFSGKIVGVERRNEGGFTRGVLKLDGTGAESGRSVTIDFQNENLIVRTESGEALAIVPDLICLVDEDSAEPITTEILRYGLRVVVIAIPAPEQLKTAAALKVVGPAAFGYPDVEYAPMAGIYGQGVATTAGI